MVIELSKGEARFISPILVRVLGKWIEFRDEKGGPTASVNTPINSAIAGLVTRT